MFTSAMAIIVEEGFMTKSQTGLINAVFWIVYAPFQIVGGIAADKYSPYKLIMIGLLGAAISNVAVVTPSFCIILLILILLKNLLKNPYVQAVLGGMQPCVVGIILATGVQLTLKGCMPEGSVDVRAVIIGLLMAALVVAGKKLLKKKLSALQLIMVSAALGILFYGI